MKKFTWSYITAALLLLLVQNALAAGPEVSGNRGQVEVTSSTTFLALGDKVKTGANGETTLQVKESGLSAHVSSNSEVSYQGVTATGAQSFKVSKGRVHFSIVPGNHLDVETPHLVASVRGTEFSTTVDDQDSELSVYEGRVAVHDSKGVTGTLTRGWSAVATSTGFTSQTSAHLSKMSSPKAIGEPAWSEHENKSDKGNAGGKSDNSNAGGNSGNSNAGGNSGNSNAGGNSGNSNAGGNSGNKGKSK